MAWERSLEGCWAELWWGPAHVCYYLLWTWRWFHEPPLGWQVNSQRPITVDGVTRPAVPSHPKSSGPPTQSGGATAGALAQSVGVGPSAAKATATGSWGGIWLLQGVEESRAETRWHGCEHVGTAIGNASHDP